VVYFIKRQVSLNPFSNLKSYDATKLKIPFDKSFRNGNSTDYIFNGYFKSQSNNHSKEISSFHLILLSERAQNIPETIIKANMTQKSNISSRTASETISSNISNSQ